MTRWLVKREVYIFNYGVNPFAEQEAEAYRNKMHNLIAKEGQDGWEPWHITGAVLVGQEYLTVWYKRPDENH